LSALSKKPPKPRLFSSSQLGETAKEVSTRDRSYQSGFTLGLKSLSMNSSSNTSPNASGSEMSWRGCQQHYLMWRSIMEVNFCIISAFSLMHLVYLLNVLKAKNILWTNSEISLRDSKFSCKTFFSVSECSYIFFQIFLIYEDMENVLHFFYW
jgi:hypothetical protein